jgi:hypothetical protein
MKKPASTHDFLELIGGMNHRERFVFELANPTSERHYLEVYLTELNGKSMFNDNRNVFFQYVDICGKNNNQPKTSILYRLLVRNLKHSSGGMLPKILEELK